MNAPLPTFTDAEGNVCTRADILAMRGSVQRWVRGRKYRVIQAIRAGVITRDEAMEWFELEPSEMDEWERGASAGKHGLGVRFHHDRRRTEAGR